jgi:hypothetical protein
MRPACGARGRFFYFANRTLEDVPPGWRCPNSEVTERDERGGHGARGARFNLPGVRRLVGPQLRPGATGRIPWSQVGHKECD